MLPWEAAQLGLLADDESLEYDEYADMPEHAGILASMLPGIGDAAGFALDAKDFWDEPTWGNGLLGAAGALPFVPSGLAGATDIFDIRKASARPNAGTFEVYENPTKAELQKLHAQVKKEYAGTVADPKGLVRVFRDKDKTYAWRADKAVHEDVANNLELRNLESEYWDPDEGYLSWLKFELDNNLLR